MYFILHAATDRQFSSICSTHDNLNTITSPISTPQSLRKLEIINEGYMPDENIAESSFTESATAMEYRIRLVEDIELLSDGNITMVSESW
jgi:signal transduction histidine kinase